MLLTLDTITLAHTLESPYGPLGAYVDAAGVEWVLTSEKGWWGSPAPRTKRTDRLTADGSFRAPNYRGARVVSLGGEFTAPSDLAMRQAQQQVLGVCADPTRLYPLTVADETGTYVAQVELDAEVLSQPVTAYRATFSVQVAAPDPRKFAAAWASVSTPLGTPGTGGVDATTAVDATAPGVSAGVSGMPGVAAASNVGTAPGGPVLQIVGPVTSPTVSDITSGATVAFTGSIDPGASVYINCDDQPMTPPGLSDPLPGHSVMYGGYSSRRAQVAISSGWPVLPPGVTRSYLFTGTSAGAPSLTVHFRSAWR